MQILHRPAGRERKAFSNGIVASGKPVFIAGQVGWTGEGEGSARFCRPVPPGARQHPRCSREGKAEHIVRLTWYVLDKHEYLSSLKAVGAPRAGRHYLTMAVVQVSGLVEDEARLEIEATAVVPEGGCHRRRTRRPVLRAAGEESVAALGHHGLRAQPPGRHVRLRRGVLGSDARYVQGLRPCHLRADPSALRLLGRRRRRLQGCCARAERLLRMLARGAPQHPAGPRARARRACDSSARSKGWKSLPTPT